MSAIVHWRKSKSKTCACAYVILSASVCDVCCLLDLCSSLTLEGQHLLGVDHDAKLENQLGGAL